MSSVIVRRFLISTWAVLVVLSGCLISAPVSFGQSTSASTGIRYAKVSRVCPPPKPGSATCFALVRVPVSEEDAGEAGVKPYTVGDGALKSGPAGGLTPEELSTAYGYDPTAGGSNQTVAIVDAFDDPSIESDLAKFDEQYGLAACTTANKCFTKVGQTGNTTELPAPDETGWSVEISLDVEAVHSACEDCKILLVEANNAELTNLAAAVNEAVSLGATEVSNSYGGPEENFGSEVEDDYNHPGVVIAAATGDSGYDDWTDLDEGYVPPARPNLPASLPSTVAVGGTTLDLDSSGDRASEKVWNGYGPLDQKYFEGFLEGVTGGGCSTLFTAQPWQHAAPGFAATGCGTKRLAADVSAVADPLTGFDIYDSYNCGEECEDFKRGRDWLTIGGTSLATPLISGMYGLAGGSKGVSYPSLTLYGHLGDPAAVFDVTQGGDGWCDAAPESECGHPNEYGAIVRGYALHVDCEYTTACDAAVGFDGPSGVGTPKALSLFEPLPIVAAITSPGQIKVGRGGSFSAATSSDPYPGATVSYTWNWGDGTADSTGEAPTHAYAALGEYTVTLSISDSYGFKSTPATAVVDVVEETAQEIKEAAEAKEREAREAKEHEEAKEREVKGQQEAKERQEAKELKEAEEARESAEASKKLQEELAAKSSVNAGQGVSGFQMSLAPVLPDAALAATSLQVTRSGAVTLKISCPTGETSCSGTISLRTLAAVIAGDGYAARQKPSVLTLATGSFTVAGGKLVAVTLHLSAKARTLLARTHTLRARATLLAHDPQGATHTTITIVTLRAAKASHHKG